MPGLGQVYVGYYTRGFVHAIVVASIITVLNLEVLELEPLFAMFLAFFWLYNIIDAGRRAAMYNHVLAGVKWSTCRRTSASPACAGRSSGA